VYIVKRNETEYYTYDGWKDCLDANSVLDLSDVVRFTEQEARRMYIPSGYQLQWYGSYK